MINRILIRIKVVQLLYSYLLTQTDFRIDSAPEAASNDKKFAYAVYLDLLLLILEISGVSAVNGEAPQVRGLGYNATTARKRARYKLAQSLASDPVVREIIFKGRTNIAQLRHLAPHLRVVLENSSVFRDFDRKRAVGIADEVNMWITVVESIFANDPELDAALRALPGYSNVGFRRGVIQLASTLKSYYSTNAGYVKACDDLQESLNKAYELYNSIFVLILELTREQELRIENAKTKHLSTPEERNPNMRFVENAFVAKLAECPMLQAYVKNNPVSWDTDIALINKLLNDLTASELYAEYMTTAPGDYATDCEFWRNALRNVIFQSDAFNEALEDKSVYWNDDLSIMGTFVLKTIKLSEQEPDKEIELLPQYKDDEDATFGAELFEDCVRHREEYRELIDKFIKTDNWDPDRMAFMDIVILTVAISEIINYPNIPIAVSINEYIEIANNYSSPKSGQFVNGVLFNIVNTLRDEGRIAK